MINRAAGKRDGVKHNHARRAKRMRQRGEIFARHHHPAHDQAEAGKKADAPLGLRQRQPFHRYDQQSVGLNRKRF